MDFPLDLGYTQEILNSHQLHLLKENIDKIEEDAAQFCSEVIRRMESLEQLMKEMVTTLPASVTPRRPLTEKNTSTTPISVPKSGSENDMGMTMSVQRFMANSNFCSAQQLAMA